MMIEPARGAEMWELNPHLEAYTPFRRLKKKFGDEISGDGMYAIYMVFDPTSPRREDGEMDIPKLKKEVGAAYIEATGLTWTIMKSAIKEYKEQLVSAPEKQLEKMHTRLIRMQDVLEAWYPDKEDAKDYAIAAEKAEKMEERYLDLYQKVSALREASKKVNTRGGGGLSMLEKIGKRQ